jgi:hypothetical protein
MMTVTDDNDCNDDYVMTMTTITATVMIRAGALCLLRLKCQPSDFQSFKKLIHLLMMSHELTFI